MQVCKVRRTENEVQRILNIMSLTYITELGRSLVKVENKSCQTLSLECPVGVFAGPWTDIMLMKNILFLFSLHPCS